MKATCDVHPCPLCDSKESASFYEDKTRTYRRCCHCMLVFVPACWWLSRKDEKAVYDLHENDARDGGYRQFLSRLSAPLLERLDPKQKGLDFGCGPGPTLSVMLEAQGHQVDLYDPIYHNDASVFDKNYDFICATEVVEHLRNPDRDFTALFRMLKPGGWLGIMTKLVLDANAFRRWHYIRDMTHICFYSRRTFDYLSHRFHAELDFVANDVVMLTKRN